MDYQLGMQIPVNPPEIDFDHDTITHDICVQTVDSIDEAILAEIHKIAKEAGVTTLFVLDKKNIKSALEKAIAKKVVRISDSKVAKGCPVCGNELLFYSNYCDECGQKVDWEDDDE
jgi:hypothetical protein